MPAPAETAALQDAEKNESQSVCDVIAVGSLSVGRWAAASLLSPSGCRRHNGVLGIKRGAPSTLIGVPRSAPLHTEAAETMSFLASFAKSGMETQEERDSGLRARVASYVLRHSLRRIDVYIRVRPFR